MCNNILQTINTSWNAKLADLINSLTNPLQSVLGKFQFLNPKFSFITLIYFTET